LTVASSFELVIQTTAWPHYILGQMLSSHSVVHRPELSGHAINGVVDGLDIGGQHGRQFVCATLTSRRGGHNPICTSRSKTFDTGAEVIKLDTTSSWEGHSRRGGCWCWGL